VGPGAGGMQREDTVLAWEGGGWRVTPSTCCCCCHHIAGLHPCSTTQAPRLTQLLQANLRPAAPAAGPVSCSDVVVLLVAFPFATTLPAAAAAAVVNPHSRTLMCRLGDPPLRLLGGVPEAIPKYIYQHCCILYLAAIYKTLIEHRSPAPSLSSPAAPG
jgi:hypothetical protein